ncbi:sodium:proton antiporter NhaD [Leucothrix arctica]|uniref:Sodium:proton antiporter n=1 Tax=Leucothrix arctica TaxID=1481894 RepID=A0A317CRU5_9GAMM|nr:sodium:proton antiporter NhaD [Leucothrix arctica]PWQ99032.1 sodium:proton antiporter [Leucothrix arctica]
MLLATMSSAFASSSAPLIPQDLTALPLSWVAVGIFVIAYTLVILEDVIHLRKSKPVIVAAGIIWVIVAIAYAGIGQTEQVDAFLGHNMLEYAYLLLFLLVAMTYINTMEERGVFDALRGWLISKGFTLRGIFWITGVLAFVISPLADNLTTALLMAAVVISVAGGRAAILADETTKKFAVLACVNIVVAANAGGAFSPFGDITTLMVWQAGKVSFGGFIGLLPSALVNWLIPAIIMSFFLPNGKPEPKKEETRLKYGAFVVVGLFIFTIFLAVSYHNFFHLPPMLGMMTGLGLLQLYGHHLKNSEKSAVDDNRVGRFDIYNQLQRSEWDTLMFFYGVILCVGGLGALGYLAQVSGLLYGVLGASTANVLVGVLSAIVDNIPVMFAVLSMNPDLSHGQWLLVTLTAGVGGSLLSVGSAAGVALMGQARGIYTFMSHLKWAWAVALGYVASIYVHMYIYDLTF